jgi:ribose/xylose/arabinose/galactoside ABC-type transport system permease subunit
VLIGVLIVTISANGLRLLNLPSSLQLIVIGVLTVVAVLAQREWRRRPARRSPPARPSPEPVGAVAGARSVS